MRSTDANFDAALAWLLDDEGRVYSGPPHIDQPTHSGITLRALSEALGRPAQVEDLMTLKQEQVRNYYYRYQWAEYNGNGPHQLAWPLSYVVFDMGVNLGRARTAKWLQGRCQVRVDGILGPVTAAAANVLWGGNNYKIDLLAHLHEKRLEVYADSDLRWRKGLMARAARVAARVTAAAYEQGFRKGLQYPDDV